MLEFISLFVSDEKYFVEYMPAFLFVIFAIVLFIFLILVMKRKD